VNGWSSGAVLSELHNPRGLQLVALGRAVDGITGWCCGLYVEDEAELLRIAVLSDQKRSGIASALLAQFEQRSMRSGVSSVFLEVAEKNQAAGQLYLKFGYRQVGRRKGYYRYPADDALIMKKMLC